MPERDYPPGHPAAADYAGEPYHPPASPFIIDFPEGHPCRGGANTSELDTPDGLRKRVLEVDAANAERTAAMLERLAAEEAKE